MPAHASRAMVAISVVRTLRKVTLPENYREVHSWVAYDGDRPVAFLSAELLSRWSPPEMFFPVEPDIDLTGPTLVFATLVDPELWGRGYATAAKMAACDHPAAARAEAFHACIRADNERSLKAISKIPGIQLVGTAAEEGHRWRHFRWHRRT
ncbi:GNAT family N-acetyltransferase [Nocardia sp. NPDC059239]|uniref:GNAT family N-acetyltransferase n=1 Tax=Nocardia sp. NPDC059239 TaxID=3346785 RepID=UPI003690A841